MSLAEEFSQRVTAEFAQAGASLDLLPVVFLRATVDVLPVGGAGLSMTDHLRIPIAASDDDVVAAERLQTTLGEGPCLGAATAGEPLVAELPAIAARWPVFYEKFAVQTPYRSVASLPLRSVQGAVLGALDLYSTSPDTLTPDELEEIAAGVAAPMASLLFRDSNPSTVDGVSFPSWLDGDRLAERMNVWVAVGMSMERLQLDNGDALALLRGYAYAHALTLDEVARQVTDRGLQPEELLA